VVYTESCNIYAQVWNRADKPILIEKVECIFECEADVPPFTPSVTPFLDLEAGHLSSPPMRVHFDVGLALCKYTNRYTIRIHYKKEGVSQTSEYVSGRSLIIEPLSPADRHFFISHKDPENTERGSHLSDFLNKLGFRGYLSELDHSPGLDLWREKIPQAIESSIALIVLWTSHESNSPHSVIREIEIANLLGKRIILARESGISVPEALFNRDIEYFPCESPIKKDKMMHLALSLERMYHRGFFSRPTK
jgi:hypothetical protein